MSVVLTTLLCVGVQLILTSGVQEPLPQPHIQTEPDSLILSGEPVTIQCFGPPWAENYLISKKEVSEDGEKTQTMNNKTLTIPRMTTQNVGLYTCSYQRGHIWSPPSASLPLVMTGAYEKPTLFAVPGPLLSPGQSVRLDCVSSVKFEMFYFILASGAHTSLSASPSPMATGSHASLHVGLGTPTQAGPYRCFGYFKNFSYVLSHPSDTLCLQLTDAPSTAPSGQPAWPTEARDPLPNIEYPTHSVDASSTAPSGQSAWPTESPDSVQHIEHHTHPADPHDHPTFKGSESVTESRATTDSPEHPTNTRPVTVIEPPRQPSFLEQYRDVVIGVSTSIIFLLLLILFLVFRRRRSRKNTQRQEGAAYQPPDAMNLGEVTYSQVTCTVTAATKPTLLPEDKSTSEYATLALR